MKQLLSLALLVFLSLSLFAACADQAGAVPETTAASQTADTLNFSSFTATDIDGAAVSGDIFAGHKLTMLNVWGTYCGPCIREMPDLARLAKEYGNDFQLVGIVLDATGQNFAPRSDKIEEAKAILAQTGADYLQLLPSESLADLLLYEIQVIPTTVFVDENGNLVGEPYYGSRSYDDWKSVIDAFLEAIS